MSTIPSDYSYMGQHTFGLFQKVIFYYCPHRSDGWALQRKKDVCFFSDLSGCLDYAAAQGWISAESMPGIRASLTELARAHDDRFFKRCAEVPEKYTIHRETR